MVANDCGGTDQDVSKDALKDNFMAGEILSDKMANPKYSIIVYNYLFGQYRIQLTNMEMRYHGCPPGHGDIVRELDTYQHETALQAVLELAISDYPEAAAEMFARDYNCEYEGGRIRLDNEPEAWRKKSNG